MSLRVVAGSGNPELGVSLARALGAEPLLAAVERFPDSEGHVEVPAALDGDDAVIVQSTGAPVDQHLIELLLLADACRRRGARRVLAVVPYLGYSRQDRVRTPGEAVSVAVARAALAAGGIERLLVVDPHSTASTEGPPPTTTVSAVELLADVVGVDLPEAAVVVAPDEGARELAERYGARLDRPAAHVTKSRLSGERVRAVDVEGSVAGRVPVLVDDIVSTGGTIEAAARIAFEAGAAQPARLAATHAVLAGDGATRLARVPLERVVFSDSLPDVTSRASGLPAQVVAIAPLLAQAIPTLVEAAG